MPISHPPPATLTRADSLLITLGFLLCLLISFTLGYHRIFWEDEMLGWMLLTDPSFSHMVHAWNLGADGGGFAFYLTGRTWLHLFGPSEIAFRAYSATCFSLAFALNWISFRRFYNRWITAFALFNTYFCSPPIVIHLVEGRFYGLLMLSASLVLWLIVILQDLNRRTPVTLYLAFFAANALLTTSHLLGFVYSFFLLLALIALDLRAKRLRPLLYISAAAAWLLLIAERTAIHASAQVGKPWFWTVQPPLYRLFGPLTGYSAEISAVLILIFVLLVLSLRSQPTPWHATLSHAFRARHTIYVLAFALLLVALTLLLAGFFGPSLFINRYLIPVSITTAFLTAEALQLIAWPALLPARMLQKPRILLLASGSTLSAVILTWVFLHLPGSIFLQPDYTSTLTSMLPKGVPVLVEDALTFTELIGRQHSSGVQYLYPLDWDQSATPLAPRVEVTQYHLMQNWQRAGYFSGSIVDLDSFLRQQSRFIVLDGQVLQDHPARWEQGDPLALRFAHTTGYTLTRLTALDCGGLIRTAWLVTHEPSTTPPPAPRNPVDYTSP